MNTDDAQRRIDLLEKFLKTCNRWAAVQARMEAQRPYGRLTEQDAQELNREEASARSAVLRMTIPVKQAVRDAGVSSTIMVGAPPMFGGRVQPIEVFSNILASPWDRPVMPDAMSIVEQSIGVYEHLRDDSGLVRLASPESLDILSALERALRPSFKGGPPTNEKEVQDHVETILQTLGVVYHREKERAAVGPTSFIPDFSVEEMSLAIEVKFARGKHGAKEIQRELAEDVAGYGTKWKHLFVLIYDCGVIDDPEQMRRENQKHFGVRVLIIKH